MKLRATAILFASVLAGCAVTDPIAMRQLEMAGQLNVTTSSKPGFDYVVTIGRAIDFGFDTVNSEDRDKLIRAYFAAQCTKIEFGDPATIRLPAMLVDNYKWIYDVKCTAKP